MISKSKIATLVIALIVLLACETFSLTPLGRLAKGAGIAGGILGYCLFAFYFKRFSKSIKEFGLIFLGLFVLSIGSSYYVFKQEITSGMVANQAFVSIGLGFLVYYIFLRFRLDIEDVKKRITQLSWVMLGIYILIVLLNIKFAVIREGDTGIAILQKGVINLGSFIYLERFFKTQKLKFFAYGILFATVNHWADFQRGLFFIFIICILVFVYYYRSKSVGIKATIVIILAIPLIGIGLSTTKSGQELLDKASQIFSVVNDENRKYTEHSIETRLTQISYASEEIKKYPITGVGRVRSKEKEAIYGRMHFFVSDIGLVGLVYTFGIFGIIVLFYQYRYLYLEINKNQLIQFHQVAGFKVFILSILLHSLLTGKSIYMAAEFFTVIALIEASKMQLKLSKSV